MAPPRDGKARVGRPGSRSVDHGVAVESDDSTAGHVAHLVICFSPAGRVDCYPEGDPLLIARGLAQLVKALHDHPARILCAAGVHAGGAS